MYVFHPHLLKRTGCVAGYLPALPCPFCRQTRLHVFDRSLHALQQILGSVSYSFFGSLTDWCYCHYYCHYYCQSLIVTRPSPFLFRGHFVCLAVFYLSPPPPSPQHPPLLSSSPTKPSKQTNQHNATKTMDTSPLVRNLLDSSAACLEHCSTHSPTPLPVSSLATRLRSFEQTAAHPKIDLDLLAQIALYSGLFTLSATTRQFPPSCSSSQADKQTSIS